MKGYKTFSIVIPAYNEGLFIGKTLDKVIKADTLGMHKEIIVVDDGSTDNTADILFEYEKKLAKRKRKGVTLKVIYNEKNRGKGSAVKDGFLASTGDLVTIQDADLEYDPDEYVRLLEPFLKYDTDVVYGSRFITERPHRVVYFWHSIGNFFLTFFSNMLTNLNLTDMETGYKVFKGDLIREIALTLESKRFGFEPEITAKLAKRKVVMYEVGISYLGRTYEEGKKIGWKDGFEAIKEIVKFNLIPVWLRKIFSLSWVFLKAILGYIAREAQPLFVLPKKKFAIFLLLTILALGAYLRIEGITWGLQTGDLRHASPYHDEGHVASLVFSGNYFEEFGEYEISKPVYFWRVFGMKTLAGFEKLGINADWISVWMLMRGINVFFGILSIYVVYLLGTHMFRYDVGLWAAAFYSLFPGHWFMSALIKGEVLVTFFMPLTLLAAYMVYKRNSLFWHVFTGVTIGMGLATKLSYAPVGIIVAVIFVLTLWRHRKSLIWTLVKFGIMGVALIRYFLLLYPYPICCQERFQLVLQDPQNAFQRASLEYIGFSPTHFTEIWSLFQSPQFPFFTIMYSEPVSYLFWLGLLGSVLYIIYLLYYRKNILLHVAFIGTFLLFFSLLQQYAGINEDRYIVPLAPFIAIFTGFLFGGHIPFLRKFRKLVGQIVLSYLLLFTIVYFIPYAYEPPRVEAAQWINEYVPEGQSVMVYIRSARDRIRFDMEKIHEVTIQEVEEGARPEYILLYETISYQGRWGNHILQGEFAEKPYGDIIPSVVNTQYTPINRFGRVPELFGDKKPETVFTPVYTLYKRNDL